jgi:hypothetical protein
MGKGKIALKLNQPSTLLATSATLRDSILSNGGIFSFYAYFIVKLSFFFLNFNIYLNLKF